MWQSDSRLAHICTGCIGIGREMSSSNSCMVSVCIKQINTEILGIAREICAFGPNRLPKTDSLVS